MWVWSESADFNRLILIGTSILVAVVLLLVSWSWIQSAFIFPNQAVAVVEGTNIKGADFQSWVKFSRQQLVNNYIQTYGEYQTLQQIFGSDQNFQQQYNNALARIQAQLDPQTIGQSVIDEMVDYELLKLEAQNMGIEISQTELDQRLQQYFGYYPNGTPSPTATFAIPAASTLSATQFAIISPTPTWTVSPTIDLSATSTPSETPTITATPAATLIPALATAAAASPTPQPTATEYTFEGYQQALSDYFSSYKGQLQISEGVIRDIFSFTMLRQKFEDEITSDLPRTQEEVWARHILVSNEADAQTVLDDLAAGQDWSALAAQFSIDSASASTGGDLGWFPRGKMVEPFENAAFDMKIGEISQPIQSQFGYHIIQVLGHEDRPVNDADYEQLRAQKLADFIQSLRDKYTWQENDSWKAMLPTEPVIPANYLQQ